MKMFSQCALFLQTDLKQRLSKRSLQFLIMGIAFASFLPDFRSSVIPRHDAREYLCAFQVYYSSLFHEGAIPLWLPYGRYGTVSALLLMYITPFGFLAGMIGKILGITDTLLLFKVGLLCEFLFYCLGVVKLALLLFEYYESVLLVSLGAIFSFSWMLSLDANLHTFYVLPFILRSLTLFLTTGSLRHLCTAGIFCVVSCIGNVPYHSPFLVLLICLFSVAMLAQGSLKGKRLAFSIRDLIPISIVLLSAVTYVGFYVVNLEGLESFSVGRDAQSRRVTLDCFTSYGGVTKLRALISEYLFGAHTQGDNTFYLGLAPLGLSLFAFLRCKRRECLAFIAVAVFLISFSYGGPVAVFTYYFPGMSLYRHVALVFGQVKVFLLIAAGFGLDQLLQNARSGTSNAFVKDRTQFTFQNAAGCVRAVLLIMLISESIISFYNTTDPWDYALWPRVSIYHPPMALTYIRLAAYGCCLALAYALHRSKSPAYSAKMFGMVHICMLAFIFDIGSFKVAGNKDWPLGSEVDTALGRLTLQPRKLEYIPIRHHPRELAQHSRELQFLVLQGGPVCVYSHVWTVAGLDPALPQFRVDFISEDIPRLFRRRGSKFTLWPKFEMLPEDDLWMKNALGYDVPKLRLIAESDLNEQSCEPDPPRPTFSPLAPLGKIGKTEISSIGLSTVAMVNSALPVRLYYADAYHPGWHAYVNGNEVPIKKTNVAFKSIPLQPGLNSIEFRFFNGWGAVCVYVLAFGSVVLLLYIAIGLLREPELQMSNDSSAPDALLT